MSTASANTEAETHSRYIGMDSLKEDTFYVLDFDLPEARGGHGRTVGLYKFGCFWVDEERDGPPPAVEDSIYRAVRKVDPWA